MPPITRVPSRQGMAPEGGAAEADAIAGAPRPATFKPFKVMPTERSAAVDIIPVKRAESPAPGSAASSLPLSPGSEVLAGTFGEYQLTGSSLGSGGFGSVLEAIEVGMAAAGAGGGALAVKTMERRTDARDAKIRHEIEVMKWLSAGMAHGRKPMERSASEPCLASAAHPIISRRASGALSSAGAGVGDSPGRPPRSRGTPPRPATGGPRGSRGQQHHPGGSRTTSGAALEAGGLSQSFRPHREKFFNGHITAIRDCVFTPEHVHIVMRAAKCNLADHIASRGRLTEAEARGYFRQLVSAVSYCHSMGVVHRDIKLENVLIGQDGQSLEIADFGLAKFVDPDTFQCASVCGTPKYIAPEVILRKRYDGRKSDVWACGVVLFAMLNGRLPFHSFKLRSLRSWAAFVDIASKMSTRRYKALVHAQFVTVPSASASASSSPAPRPARAGSAPTGSRHMRGSGRGRAGVLCSPEAQALVQEMLTFLPEDRCDTDELSFHPWMHPEEHEDADADAGAGRSGGRADSTAAARRGGGNGIARGCGGDDDGHSSSDSGASLVRTRRAVARDAPAWAPDASATECAACGRGFNLFRRRHHCRRCGLIFCNTCAPKRSRAALPEAVRDFAPVRCPGEVEAELAAPAVSSLEPEEHQVLRVCDGCCGGDDHGGAKRPAAATAGGKPPAVAANESPKQSKQ